MDMKLPKMLAVPALLSSLTVLTGCMPPADIIYYNGNIVTVDGTEYTAKSLIVTDGVISYVGPDFHSSVAEIGKLKDLYTDADTITVDLQGKTVIPGFYDSHSHMVYSGMQAISSVNLNSPPLGTMKTMADIQAALTARAAQTPADGWIQGANYDDTLLAEKRHPTKADLDAISSTRPIYVTHSSGHIVVANSAALALAGIDASTKDPEGGIIGRDENGEPNGILYEAPASNKVFHLIPRLSNEQMFQAVAMSANTYAARGVTTGNSGASAAGLIGLMDAAKNVPGVLPINVNASPFMTEVQAAYNMPVTNSDSIRVIGVKEFVDGSIQGYTGYLEQPYHTAYHGDDQYVGFPRQDKEALAVKIASIHDAGRQAVLHTNGDAAINDALYGIRKAQEANPRPDTRHILIHAQMATEAQLDEMAALGVIPSFFNLHTYYWGERHRDIFLGEERASRISAMNSAAARGLRFTIHADTPVVPMNPMLMLWSAVNRQTYQGDTLGYEQAVTPIQALEALTINGAYQFFQEDTKGSLEVGKVADLAILSANPLTVDPMAIRNIYVTETVVAGKTVFKIPAQQ
ncbi:MAG: amidohydrolase [Pseudomonadales bacterium]|nr:amidohydrolase [Pseudomonadales bacterium]